jgi:hypothetical protein
MAAAVIGAAAKVRVRIEAFLVVVVQVAVEREIERPIIGSTAAAG